ncbi:MAG: hypothetical protein HGA24_01680, partial [Candidatus Aminicenantes bacterium]|nr:hypothetical protein [Candidatus Aminicenantes bacterium]
MRTSQPSGRIAFGLFLLVAAAVMTGGRPAQEVPYGVGSWDPESGLGNHRAVIRVAAPPAVKPASPAKGAKKMGASVPSQKPSVVQARIPWRRRDLLPEAKNVIVVDAATGARITNVLPLAVTREFGFLLFEPKTVPGEYHVYYMPYKSEGRKNYPNVKYDLPQVTEDLGWMETAKAALSRNEYAVGQIPLADIPRAEFVELQSADAFSAFTPMEIIATAAETKALLAAHPGAPYLLFPEDRARSIRMTGDLPYHWAVEGPGGVIKGEAARGEYFTFQIGVWAAREAIVDLEVEFSDLIQPAAKIEDGSPAALTLIPTSAMTCINKGGVGWDGTPFKKAVPVEKGEIQALWCGIDIPRDAKPGVFNGTVTVTPEGLPATALAVEVRVADALLEDAGDADPARMTRLSWLDSRLAQDDGIVPPYTPLTVDGLTVGCLGRSLTIGPDGLPAGISSYFAPEMTRLQSKPVPLTSAPFKLRVVDVSGRELTWVPDRPGPRPVQKGPGAVVWETVSRAGGLTMMVTARMEFDGFVDYKVALSAERNIGLSAKRLCQLQDRAVA